MPTSLMQKPAQPNAPPTFEAALDELETIVQNMESGKLALEDALGAYQRGIELLKFCQSALAAADQKIRILEGSVLREFPLEGENNR